MRVLIFNILTGILLVACGCEKHKSKNTQDLDMFRDAEQKGEYIYSSLTDEVYLSRCDKLTFKALLSIYEEQDISAHETDGKWDRDVFPCYPKHSKSSISFDGILSVLHHVVSTQDMEMLDRLINYCEENDWTVGEGPTEYTNIAILSPMMYAIKKHMALVGMDEILSGFRGHLLASYIWLNLRLNGSCSELETRAIEKLVEANPADPMYLALYHRLKDGEQSEALRGLLYDNEFSIDTIYETDGVFGWGSAPSSVYYLVTLSIIQGK